MPINQNHLFEELDGVKCAIVEKNAARERVDFLKKILEYNNYTVIVVASPPPKPAPVSPTVATGATEAISLPAGEKMPPPPATPETFTVGVTDVTFNSTNAIFGRLLKTSGGHIVTLSYWQQKESKSRDDIPYFN